jgi:hypothetical protein
VCLLGRSPLATVIPRTPKFLVATLRLSARSPRTVFEFSMDHELNLIERCDLGYECKVTCIARRSFFLMAQLTAT